MQLTRLTGRFRRRRTAALAGVAVVAAAAVAGSTGLPAALASTPPPAASAHVADPTPAPLAFTDCAGGFECATLQVPLDYRDPTGRSLALAVVRHRVADPTQRVGTLLLQPGGPGSSGVSFARSNYANLRPALRDHFDVVGFDVRGVAASSQLRCWTDAEYAQAFAQSKGRPGPDAFTSAATLAASFDAACQQRAADLVPFLGTDYVARDIDQLRQALGEDKLTFYGRSFGTYIGTIYANLFPEHVRAMALDGAYDPSHYANHPYSYDRPQFLALDAAVGRFLDWCAQTPASCPFGGGDPRTAFDKLLRDLDANPVTIPNRGTANGMTVVYRLLFNINTGKVFWPTMGKALAQAQARDVTSFLLSPPSSASYDFVTVNTAVECVDRAIPKDLHKAEFNLAVSARLAPLMGPPVAYAPPFYDHNHAPACAQWPFEPVSRYHGSFHAKGAPPILVIGTTGDPDTPYQDAVTLSKTFDKATLLTFQADGHSAFGHSACANAAVTAYLADLTLPPAGTVCTDEVPPVAPTTTSLHANNVRPGSPIAPGVPGPPAQEGVEWLGLVR